MRFASDIKQMFIAKEMLSHSILSLGHRKSNIFELLCLVSWQRNVLLVVAQDLLHLYITLQHQFDLLVHVQGWVHKVCPQSEHGWPQALDLGSLPAQLWEAFLPREHRQFVDVLVSVLCVIVSVESLDKAPAHGQVGLGRVWHHMVHQECEHTAILILVRPQIFGVAVVKAYC